MKIGFVCNEYPPGPHGGIGTLTRTLARALVSIGHSARAVGIYSRNYPGPNFETDGGVSVWRLRAGSGRGEWLRSRARLFRIIQGWARAGEIDLVEVPDWEGWAAGWPALPVPVVTRLSGSATYFASEIGRPIRRVASWIERASLKRADFRCSESRYLEDRTATLFGLDPGPDAVLYNPVELPPGAQAERSRDRVVFAGTLTEKKGIFSLARAWPLLLRRRPGVELHIFGKDGCGPDGRSTREVLERILGACGGDVQFHGHVELDRLLSEFSRARVAVLPSYAEGFSLTPLHAMACGCPTVYTRRGSGRELITHGEDGLLVDPDDPEEIAAAVAAVLADEALAQRLSRAGRERVARSFRTEVLIRANEAFYRECLERFAGRRRAA